MVSHKQVVLLVQCVIEKSHRLSRQIREEGTRVEASGQYRHPFDTGAPHPRGIVTLLARRSFGLEERRGELSTEQADSLKRPRALQ